MGCMLYRLATLLAETNSKSTNRSTLLLISVYSNQFKLALDLATKRAQKCENLASVTVLRVPSRVPNTVRFQLI